MVQLPASFGPERLDDLDRFLGLLPAEHHFGWIGEGREPYVMIHVPNNVHSPPLARTFHELLRQRLADDGEGGELKELPPFPAETEEPEPEQLTMF